MKIIGVIRPSMDTFGIGISFLCMIHCLVFPFIVSFAPQLMRQLPGDDTLHRTLLVAILLLGFLAFRRGYRIHQRRYVLSLFLVGVVFVSVAAIWGESTLSVATETAITSCGSLLIITAHILNHRHCRSCACCSVMQKSSEAQNREERFISPLGR
jgi:MerC mercury resistance protein